MKTRSMMAALGLLLGTAGVAHAEVTSDTVRIFGDNPDLGSAVVGRHEVTLVDKHCAFEMMSRMGPDPEDVARCDTAISMLVAKGPAAAPAIFAALDDPEMVGYSARGRLYDVLARTRDTRLIEPLVRAMAIVASGDLQDRQWEVSLMEDTLQKLTHADVGVDLPWEEATVESDRVATTRKVVAWRLWQKENEGRSYAELAAARLASARLEADDADPAKAFRAVNYLLKHAPVEGLAKAAKIEERAALPEAGLETIHYVAEGIRDELVQKQLKVKPAPAKVVLPVRKPAPAAQAAVPRS